MNVLSILLIFILILNGCKVGPDYEPPVPKIPDTYTEAHNPPFELIEDEDLCSWWSTFNDPFLDQLLNETIDNNFDYRIALEQVYQARAQYWVAWSGIFPEFDAEGAATRFRSSQNLSNTSSSTAKSSATGVAPVAPSTLSISPNQNFFHLGLDAIWEIDLFGALRRNADAAYDTWEATAEESRGVKITVISEVINTYATISALQKKIEIQQSIVDLDKHLVDLSQDRFQSGLANELELDNFLSALKGDEAAYYALLTDLKINIYSLATLIGRLPETLMEEFQDIHPIPTAAGKIPISLPGDLLRRRPDISSAERQLAAATEQIGIAMAELFPKVSLLGSTSFAGNPQQGANIGFSSNQLNKLFNSKSMMGGMGAAFTFPVFDFGKRAAAIDVEIALQRQSYLNYQKTVIAAFQEAEQDLAAYVNEEKRLSLLSEQVNVAQKSLDLATDLFQAGLSDYLSVLQAKAVWLTAMTNKVESQQLLTTDLVAIYKAMGGHW